MRKTLFSLLFMSAFLSTSYGQKSTQVKLKANESTFEVKTLKSTGFTVESSIATLNLKQVTFQEGNYISLESDGLIKSFTEGMPNIPSISKLIEVPQGAEVEFIVRSFSIL